MDNKSYLNSFLEILKDSLGFDFNINVYNDKVKLQKYVYLAKYFGWKHTYFYKLYLRGPYSSDLADDYYYFENNEYDDTKTIENFNKVGFINLVESHDVYWLEASATLSYYYNKHKNFYKTKSDLIEIVSKIKPNIPINTIEGAYDSLCNYGLIEFEEVCSIKAEGVTSSPGAVESEPDEIFLESTDMIIESTTSKLTDNISYFDSLDESRNSMFISGSLDYLLIVLEKEDIDNQLKRDLFNSIMKYVIDMESIKNLIKLDPEMLINMDLAKLERDFDYLQDFISEELNILPRLDDENFDLELLVA